MMSTVQSPRLNRSEDGSKVITKQIIQELYERDVRSVDPVIRPKGRDNLHPHVVTFLSEVEHSRRLTKRFLEVLDRSVRDTTSWDPQQAQIAFQCLENYALNLLDAPWRKEYKLIRIYNGFYQVKIQPHLKQALDIFAMMGYQTNRPGYLKLKQPVSPKTVGMVASECFIAAVECSLMVQIRDKVSYMRCGIQQIYKSRIECSGGVIKCVLWITNLSGGDKEQKSDKVSKDKDVEKVKPSSESNLIIEQVAKEKVEPKETSDVPVRPKRTKDERRTISQDNSNDDLAAVLAPKLHNKTISKHSKQEKKQSRSMDDLLGCKNKHRALTLRRGGSADTEIIDKRSQSKERVFASSTKQLSESDDALVFKPQSSVKSLRKRGSRDTLHKSHPSISEGSKTVRTDPTNSGKTDHDHVIADFSDLVPENQVSKITGQSQAPVEEDIAVEKNGEETAVSESDSTNDSQVLSNGNSYPSIEDDSLRERLRAIDATPESPQLSEFRAKFSLMTHLPIKEDVVAKESSKDISESDVTPDSDTTSESQPLPEFRHKFFFSPNRPVSEGGKESADDKVDEKEKKSSDSGENGESVQIDGENMNATEDKLKDEKALSDGDKNELDMCDTVDSPKNRVTKDGTPARPASMHVEGSQGVPGITRKDSDAGRPQSVHSDKPASGHLEGAAYTSAGPTEDFDKLHDKFQPRAGLSRPILSQAPKIEGIKLHRPKTSPTCAPTRSWQMNIVPISTPPPCILLKDGEGLVRPKQESGAVHKESEAVSRPPAPPPPPPPPPKQETQYTHREPDVPVPVLVRAPISTHPHQHITRDGDIVIRAHAIPWHEHHHIEAVPVVCEARHYHDGHSEHVHYGHVHDGKMENNDGYNPAEVHRAAPQYEPNPFIENCTCTHRTGTVLRRKVPHAVLMEHQFKSLLLAKDPRTSYTNDGIPTFSTFGKNQDPHQPSSAAEKHSGAGGVDDADSGAAQPSQPVVSAPAAAATQPESATAISQHPSGPVISPRASSLGANVVVDGTKLMTPTIIATPPSPMKSDSQPVADGCAMWQCQTCTFANMTNENVCEMCTSPRVACSKKPSPPPPPPPKEGRVCSECTFLNKPNAKRCEMCEEDFTLSTFV